MTMQQLVGMVQGLQEAMASSGVDQKRMQADLTASLVRNEELHRTNEELRRDRRDVDEPETVRTSDLRNSNPQHVHRAQGDLYRKGGS